MDRKEIIGVICAVLGLVCWTFYSTNETNKLVRAQQEAAEAAKANAPAEVPAIETDVIPAPAATVAAPEAKPVAEPAPAETLEKLSTSAVEYSFTNVGAGISRAVLFDHTVEKNAKVVLNEFGSIPIGAITDTAGEGIAQVFAAAPAPGEITFTRTDSRQLEIVKKFTLPKLEGLDAKAKLREEYLLHLEVTFRNTGAEPIASTGYFVHTGSAAPVHQADLPTYTGFNWLKEGGNEFVDVNWFSSGGFAFWSHPERPIYLHTHPSIGWAGVTNQYFTSLVTPIVDDKAGAEIQQQQRAVAAWARRFAVSNAAWKANGHSGPDSAERFAVDGAIGMPGFSLKPGESTTRTFAIYAGPREQRRLAELSRNEAEMMNFGIFSIVSKTLLASMNTLRAWLGNYAWAIIVLTLIIKTLMWPLQNKATNSMKRMQALQPKMTELREKYKDDPTRMNTELMKLYKDYGINPLSGCLPMLIQIPIFFGFYNMLGAAVELRNSPFLWVNDLSQPDTIAVIAGLPINPLPLLMAVTMFWQMAISPKSGDPVQQRVFMFMPLIFIFFCYNFASALALYWTVQNLFSVMQLYLTRNQAPPMLVRVTPPATKKKK